MSYNDDKGVGAIDLVLVDFLWRLWIGNVSIHAHRLDIELQEPLTNLLSGFTQVFGCGTDEYLHDTSSLLCAGRAHTVPDN